MSVPEGMLLLGGAKHLGTSVPYLTAEATAWLVTTR
jgi:hypothetical protein